MAMSLIFYMWGSPQFLLEMIAVIITNYIFGIQIDKANVKEDLNTKKKMLFFSVLINIVVLFVFKYQKFSINNINDFITGVGLNGWRVTKITLPVGSVIYIFSKHIIFY